MSIRPFKCCVCSHHSVSTHNSAYENIIDKSIRAFNYLVWASAAFGRHWMWKESFFCGIAHEGEWAGEGDQGEGRDISSQMVFLFLPHLPFPSPSSFPDLIVYICSIYRDLITIHILEFDRLNTISIEVWMGTMTMKAKSQNS